MSPDNESRELGVEFGPLAEDLREEEYPISIDDVLEQFGDRQIELQDGSQSVREILAPLGEETFDSPADVEERVIGSVSDDAIGRKRYDDRDGLTGDEHRTEESI